MVNNEILLNNKSARWDVTQFAIRIRRLSYSSFFLYVKYYMAFLFEYEANGSEKKCKDSLSYSTDAHIDEYLQIC